MKKRSAVEVLSHSVARERRAPTDAMPSRRSTKKVWRGVHVGGYNLLLDPTIQGEIQESLHIQPIPRSREFCQGLVNLRGNLVAIYDLCQYLGEDSAPQRWYLVLHNEPAWVGFAMNVLPDQLSLGEEDRLAQLPPLPDGLDPYVRSGYRLNDQLWLELDFNQLFEQLANEAIVNAA